MVQNLRELRRVGAKLATVHFGILRPFPQPINTRGGLVLLPLNPGVWLLWSASLFPRVQWQRRIRMAEAKRSYHGQLGERDRRLLLPIQHQCRVPYHALRGRDPHWCNSSQSASRVPGFRQGLKPPRFVYLPATRHFETNYCSCTSDSVPLAASQRRSAVAESGRASSSIHCSIALQSCWPGAPLGDTKADCCP